ncbi:MAG: hypothetical protein ABI273_20280, partial [Lacunisphaera sp.]
MPQYSMADAAHQEMTKRLASTSFTKLLVCLFLLMEGGISSAAPRTAVSSASASMADLNGWTAVRQMSPGINIGNTFENTTAWETGWGNPVVTKEYIQSLAR